MPSTPQEVPRKDLANAEPTKDFFINMITRDISLEDCILDLLDNCIDGAKKHIYRKKETRAPGEFYRGYWAKIHIDKDKFSIEDNCGGISVADAKDYAFHFGKSEDRLKPGYQIGVYGIGMKRAMFKLGNNIQINSSTEAESFKVDIDVQKWKNKKDWNFDMSVYRKRVFDVGTKILISDLNKGAKDEFSVSVFRNHLIRTIARDYSFLILKGFNVEINNHVVTPYEFLLKESAKIKPARYSFTEDGVRVELAAGLADVKFNGGHKEDTAAVEYFGWYVMCNERVVIASDKTQKTVWGVDGGPVWHNQYYGFLGIVHFKSSDPSKLPWTTTKRDIEQTHPLYRQAVTRHMIGLTKIFTKYTTERKKEMEKAKQIEKDATPVKIHDLKQRDSISLPSFLKGVSKKDEIKISYEKPREEVGRVAEALGNVSMRPKKIGILTFDYYYKREVE